MVYVFKGLLTDTGIQIIDSDRIDYDFIDVSWDITTMSDASGYTEALVPDKTHIMKYKETDPTNPQSGITKVWDYTWPAGIGPVNSISVTYDGWIAFYSDDAVVGVLKSDRSEIYTYQLPKIGDEFWGHNSFAIDENNRFYIQSTDRIVCVQWDGVNSLSLVWECPYDFVGDGAGGGVLGSDGSGTTNTLMGTDGMDKLVVAVDGHRNNNMVAFWREDIPADWAGLPGYDRRIAAVVELPYSTIDGEGYTMECSPAARGYSIAGAQYNGFDFDCSPVPGVQKLTWNPATRTLNVDWATDAVMFGGVITYSEGSNLLYQTGRVGNDCNYKFYGLNWDTGAVEIELTLGTDNMYRDAGNSLQINDNRNATYCGEDYMHQIRIDGGSGGGGGSCGAMPMEQDRRRTGMLALTPLLLALFMTGLWFFRRNG